MRLKLIFAATAFVTSSFALADSYRAEIGANAARFDADGLNSSANVYDVNGKYYFKSVKTDNLPLGEAAYLGKSSNAFLTLGRTYGKGYLPDTKVYNGGVEVYIPESYLYIKVEGNHYRYDHSSDTDTVTTVGITPIDGLRLTTSWNSDEGYDANIDAKYVTALGNGHYINLEASLADTDFGGTYASIGGDYYFDNTFSVGGEISDDDQGTDYLVRTRKFFTEQFSGDLTYADTEFGKAYGVGVNFRF